MLRCKCTKVDCCWSGATFEQEEQIGTESTVQRLRPSCNRLSQALGHQCLLCSLQAGLESAGTRVKYQAKNQMSKSLGRTPSFAKITAEILVTSLQEGKLVQITRLTTLPICSRQVLKSLEDRETRRPSQQSSEHRTGATAKKSRLSG